MIAFIPAQNYDILQTSHRPEKNTSIKRSFPQTITNIYPQQQLWLTNT